MLKTYRIIPLVSILFLFGFTLITVSPVFAQSVDSVGPADHNSVDLGVRSPAVATDANIDFGVRNPVAAPDQNTDTNID